MKKFLKKTAVLITMLALIAGMLPAGSAEAAKKKKTKTIVVTTQEELVAALKKYKSAGSNVTIKIETIEKSTFTLNAKYSSDYIKIVVDAPNATIKSKATVGSITINEAKSVKEYASGNKITVNDEKVTITAMPTASVEKLTIASETGTVKVVNNGGIEKVSIKSEVTVEMTQNGEIGRVYAGAAADLSFSGTSEESLKITIQKDADGATIKSSIPLNVNNYADADMTLEKGAENSKITMKEETAGVKLNNNTDETVSVKDPDGKTLKVGTGDDLTTDNYIGKPENPDPSEDTPTAEQPKDEDKKEEEKKEDEQKEEEQKEQEQKEQEQKEDEKKEDENKEDEPQDPTLYTYPGQIYYNNPTNNRTATITFGQITGGSFVVKQGSTTLSSGAKVSLGSTITITLTPDATYDAGGVAIDAGAGTLSGSGTSWSVSNIAGDMTINVAFIPKAASTVTLKASTSGSGSVVSGRAIGGDIFITLSVANENAAVITVTSGAAINILPEDSISEVHDYSGAHPAELDLSMIDSVYSTQKIVNLILSKFPSITKVYYRGNEALSSPGVTFVRKQSQDVGA